jgi:peptidase M24
MDKYAQVAQVLKEKNIGLWLLMGRETVDICDPGLRLVLPSNIMGVSAFFFTPEGGKKALVRRQDVSGVEANGVFDRVVGYGDDFDDLLQQMIAEIDPNVIDINVDLYDAMTDGLTTGLYLRLMQNLKGTPYAERISYGQAIRSIRGRKCAGEIELQRQVLKLLNQVCAELQEKVHVGTTEEDVYDYCQAFMKEHGMVGSWENSCCPLVHAGARSNQGLVHPDKNPIRPGDTFHLSFGAKRNGYATDFQRTWYVFAEGEKEVPQEVQHAFDTIRNVIETVRTTIRPGIEGRQVDEIARRMMEKAGFAYSRGSGHAVGMALHDGCFQLCPDSRVLGDLPARKLETDNVFTLEFFCDTSHGVVAMEEMIRLTENGGEYVYLPQTELWTING